MKQPALFLLLLVLCGVAVEAKAQEESLFLSLDAGPVAGYVPWKSFSGFRKEYNSSNSETLKQDLGLLSYQYGYSVGVDCFVANHLYSGVDYYYAHGKTAAKFNNNAERIITTDINTISTFIGWLQPTTKGYWTLSTGFSFAFGTAHSFLKFPDGTVYKSTGGLSGEFHDINFGGLLKFEWNRNLTEKLGLRFGGQLNYYARSFDLGMQNTFVTMTAGAIELNGRQINFDVSGVTVFCGLSYKLFGE